MNTRIGAETAARVREHWGDILRSLAEGELVGPLCARLDLKPEWLRAYRQWEPNARQEWELAREQSADAFAEKALSLAMNPVQVIPQEGKEPLIMRIDPANARNAIDTLKWAARIRNPRLYSDKNTLDINVKTVDLTRIISDANARLAAARNPELAARAAGAVDAEILTLALPSALKDLF